VVTTSSARGGSFIFKKPEHRDPDDPVDDHRGDWSGPRDAGSRELAGLDRGA